MSRDVEAAGRQMFDVALDAASEPEGEPRGQAYGTILRETHLPAGPHSSWVSGFPRPFQGALSAMGGN